MVLRTDKLTNERMYICDCRVAFATGNLFFINTGPPESPLSVPMSGLLFEPAQNISGGIGSVAGRKARRLGELTNVL